MNGHNILQSRFNESESNLAVIEFGAHHNSRLTSPTVQVSAEWQFVYSYFNQRMFDDVLPDCIITFTRHPGAQGYFCSEAFLNRVGNTAHEIAMNPAYFDLGDRESYATLVHEMVHLWRHLFGRRNRKGGLGEPGYHDMVWAEKMETLGLMPSHTGRPGGRKTGYHMRDYPVDGGPFDLACRELLISGHTVNWRDARVNGSVNGHTGETDDSSEAQPAATSRRKTRTTFVCGCCSLKVQAKASARIACLDCNRVLVAR